MQNCFANAILLHHLCRAGLDDIERGIQPDTGVPSRWVVEACSCSDVTSV